MSNITTISEDLNKPVLVSKQSFEKLFNIFEELTVCISSCKSMITIANGTSFENFPPIIMHNYFGGLDTVLSQAQDLCSQLSKLYDLSYENIPK